MKKSNLIKVVSILVISVMVMLFATTVNAANTIDLTETLTNNNTANNVANNTGNNVTNNTANNIANNTNNKTNTSVYNNTDLPDTGIEDSIPVAMLVVVFGISAVYAYTKIKEYRNI